MGECIGPRYRGYDWCLFSSSIPDKFACLPVPYHGYTLCGKGINWAMIFKSRRVLWGSSFCSA